VEKSLVATMGRKECVLVAFLHSFPRGALGSKSRPGAGHCGLA
jgi:hypothetical protein